MTEDYELGLRLGALGVRTMFFVRLPALPRQSRNRLQPRPFPRHALMMRFARRRAGSAASLLLAGTGLAGAGGLGERWMRMRDRRGPLAALLMFAGFLAAFLWGQMWLSTLLGAPRPAPPSPALFTLLTITAALLGWRVLMRVGFTTAA